MVEKSECFYSFHYYSRAIKYSFDRVYNVALLILLKIPVFHSSLLGLSFDAKMEKLIEII